MNPTTVSGSIVVGVLSGVIASGLLFLVVRVFNRIVLPWYQNAVYRGIRVDGEWDVGAEATSQVAKLNLVQHADRITGTCTFVHENPEEQIPAYESIRACTVTGTIRD